jgi:hypothetical protein
MSRPSSWLGAPVVLIVSLAGAGCAPPAFAEPLDSTTSSLDRPLPPDADKDGAPDPDDCDPQSSELGARLVEDSLATATGAIAPAPGFSELAWEHSKGAWRQLLARDAGDASLFPGTLQGDVSVEVTTAITRTTDSVAIPFRQDLVLVGARADAAGDFSAYGCGVELIDDVAKTSIVRLSGSADGIRTTSIKREVRDYLEVGEEFDIAVRVTAGTIKCTVTTSSGSEGTTLVAAVDGALDGAAGLYTRQAAALFKAARICKTKA